MRVRKRFLPFALLTLVACCASDAGAAVRLSITDNIGPPDRASVTPGGSFAFTLSIIVDGGEEPTGLDYLFRASATGPDLRIVSRSFTGSAFPDPTTPNLTTGNGNRLDPDTTNLGSSRAAGASALGNGTFLVADYTLSVGATAPQGNYSIVTAPLNSGTGYSTNTAPFDFEFTQQGSYLVTVVPEPGGLAAVGLVVAGLFARRRRTAGR